MNQRNLKRLKKSEREINKGASSRYLSTTKPAEQKLEKTLRDVADAVKKEGKK